MREEFALSFRLRTHRTQDAHWQGGDHLLRHPGHPTYAAMPVQHRRRDGAVLPLLVLEGVLLRLHTAAAASVGAAARRQPPHEVSRAR